MISMMKISTKPPLVISYSRWSSAIQGEGDSGRRQTTKPEDYCAKRDWPLPAENFLTDAGFSAYKGKNLSHGALGQFVKAAQEGKFPKGTVLLIEEFDRMTRLETADALQLFLNIINAGITIITLVDEVEFNRENLDTTKLIISIIKMEQNHKASAEKARWVSDSWVGRHQRMEETGEISTGNLPAWLTKDPKNPKKAVVNEDKASIVQMMFDMSIHGHGLPSIAKTLNANGVKPWSMEKRSKGRAEYWTVASVNYILSNPAVYGEHYSPKLDRSFPNHFPVIVSKEDFFRSQAAKAQRKQIGRGKKGKQLSNLFSGIARCHDCGEPMTIRNPKRGRAMQFYCKGTLNGVCKARPWNYEAFEANFLSLVNELDMPEIINGGTGSRANEITAEITSLSGQISDLEKRIASLMESVQTAIGSAKALYEKKINELASELDEAIERKRALEAERFAIQSQQRASQETNLVEFSDDPETRLIQRTKAMQHIKTLVDCVIMKKHVPGKFASYLVSFHGGGSRVVYVDFSNPTKVQAVLNGGKGDDVLPTDKTEALDLLQHWHDEMPEINVRFKMRIKDDIAAMTDVQS